ncbi:MAG TPA: nitrilase-related carbon-nitrogen hydrolase, partial [Gammaproteobacteria bacterium]|nr:nitrilase-related carbon-nitrogen hydrolase [Gammaproteobacteria bacterium]
VREWLRLMNLPYSDFTAGAAKQPLLELAGWPLGVSICYEAVFGEELIADLPQAALLVNVSNDAWFGDSIGPHQHFQIARMRARETERWLLRATNTGITAAVDPSGRSVAQLPQFEAGVLRVSAEPRRGATPYVKGGNVPVVLGLLLALAAGLGMRRGTRGGA